MLLASVHVAQLSRLPAKPRTARRPSYPRAIGVGIALALAACGGLTDDVPDKPFPAGGAPGAGSQHGSPEFGGGIGGGTGGGSWSDSTKDAQTSGGGSANFGGVSGSGGDPWGGGYGGGAGTSGWDEDAAFVDTVADAGPSSDSDGNVDDSDAAPADAASDPDGGADD